MANYYVKQYAYSGSNIETVSSTPSILSIPYSLNDQTEDKMQQLVIYFNTNLSSENCYLVKLTMPQDKNYDFNYGIRLMNLNNTAAQNLKDSPYYQFIKYITIPKTNLDKMSTSTIWHYYIKEDNNTYINAAMAKAISSIPNDEIDINNMNTFYYYEDTSNTNKQKIYYRDFEGRIVKEDGEYKNYWDIIKKNTFKSANNFDTTEEKASIEFLFSPSTSCNAIYLYLKPNEIDRDLRWTEESTGVMMTGRYINPRDITVNIGTVAPVNINSTDTITNIGIWGRSEQLMLINGQELSIGPSGYYELKNYDINSLYIANTITATPADRYTVDVQYMTNN